MKTKPDHLQAFAAFNDESRRFGVRVRRVDVIQIHNGLDCASVEYREKFRPVGRVVPFVRLARSARDLRAKIRAAFPSNLSRARQGSPAVLS